MKYLVPELGTLSHVRDVKTIGNTFAVKLNRFVTPARVTKAVSCVSGFKHEVVTPDKEVRVKAPHDVVLKFKFAKGRLPVAIIAGNADLHPDTRQKLLHLFVRLGVKS